jgi:hypothetical protein
MAQTRPLVLFLHGLNTYGDELIHLGPFQFGTMHARWQTRLEALGIEFHAIEDMGSESPEEQAIRTLDFLKRKKLLQPGRRVHLLGHSVGGLVARALSKIWPHENGIATIITFGTPHFGAKVAEHGIDLHLKAPTLHKLFKSVGYDATTRSGIFKHFTPSSLERFNACTPTPPNVRCVSFICSVPRKKLPIPYKLVYERFHPGEATESDGFIFCESQKWEEYRGPYQLDHFAQMGMFLFLRGKNRKASMQEFDRITSDVAALVHSMEKLGFRGENLKTEPEQPKKNL